MDAEVRMDWSGTTSIFAGVFFFRHQQALEIKCTTSSAIPGQ